MLRVKNRCLGQARKVFIRAASLGLLAITSAAGLVRGAAAADEQPAKEQPVAEAARLEKPNDGIGQPRGPAEQLFAREPFDPALMRVAKNGGFVIRVGEAIRDPRFAPYVPMINAFAVLALPNLGASPDGFDVSQIEWIAGNLHAVAKTPKKGGGPAFMVGTQSLVIRLNRPTDWQQVILGSIPLASLETYQGQNYVQLPPLPDLDQGTPLLRFPDDKTIVVLFGNEQKDQGVEEKIFKRLFDDAPNDYAWTDAWRKADGGLLTLAVDNREVGWQNEENLQDAPKVVWPALQKTGFVAFGFDWDHQTDRMAVRVESVCADQPAAEEVCKAAQEFVVYLANLWSNPPEGEGADLPEVWMIEAVSSAQVRLEEQPGKPSIVETTAEVSLPLPKVKAPAKAAAKLQTEAPADAADDDAADDAD